MTINASHICIDANDIEHFAVAIVKTDHGNMHTGIAYRFIAEATNETPAKNELMFFHQAFHCLTKNEPINEIATLGGPFFFIRPKLLRDRAIAIREFCGFVADLKEQIGYALQHDPEALFDPDTGRLAIPNGLGLSCATFVLALFRGARFLYLDTKNWPTGREGDIEAHTELMKMLDKYCSDKQHVEAVRKEAGCARFRPEEVAGAALCSVYPVPARKAEDCGYFVRGGIEIQTV